MAIANTSPTWGAAATPTPTMTMRTMVSSLLLFLVLLIVHHDIFVAVDAFATISRTRTTVTSGSTILWSGASTLKEETTTTTTKDIVESESSSMESEETTTTTSKTSSDIVVNENGNGNTDIDSMTMMKETEEEDESESEVENLMKQIKESGVAGIISYAAWELAFWTVSVPVCVLGYKEVTGHWPDFNDKDDLSKLGAEAFAFVNFARFAVPLRIGLALGTIPWIQENIVDVFLVDSNENENENDMECEEEKKDIVEERDASGTTTTMTTTTTAADADESSIVQSTKDEEEEEEKEDTKLSSRFRIRVRLGNLINRVLRRNNRSQQEEKE